ncbi:uncharacterized protein LOC144447826 [Glandiceps talaboti]
MTATDRMISSVMSTYPYMLMFGCWLLSVSCESHDSHLTIANQQKYNKALMRGLIGHKYRFGDVECEHGPWIEHCQQRQLEKRVLSEIYHATNGTNWTNNDDWLNEAVDHCMWHGVCCNHQGLVFKILLVKNNLNGLLPDLSRFQFLKELNVNSNYLKGEFNRFLKSNMTYLEKLTISFNQLSGKLLGSLIKNMPLRFVQLSTNIDIDGELPVELCEKTNLTVLSVGETSVTGPIPECLGENKDFLRFLDFEYTKMRSRYPKSLTYLRHFRSMHMSGMGLYGKLPSSFGQNYTNLVEIFMENNNLSGFLPETVGYMTNLARFDIASNNFQGKMPENLTHLPNLTQVRLKNNSFNVLPTTSFRSKQLRLLDMSENPLQTNVSAILWLLTNSPFVSWLNVSSCLLQGEIDVKLYSFEYLNYIDFSHNNLTGPIPNLKDDMPFLTTFILYNNDLSGEVPRSYIKFTSLRMFDIRRNPKMHSYNRRLGGMFSVHIGNMVAVANRNFSCPAVSLLKQDLGECIVQLDPSYYSYDHCTCNEHHFGEAGRCRPCMEHGTCSGRDVISNMTYDVNYWPSKSPDNATVFEPCSVSKVEKPVCNVEGTCQCYLEIDKESKKEVVKCEQSCVCRENHTGRKCLDCISEEYYHDSSQTCRPCFEDKHSSYKVLAGIFSVTVLVVVLAWIVRWRVKEQSVYQFIPTTALQVAALVVHLILCVFGYTPFWGFQLTFVVIVTNLSGIGSNAQGVINGMVFHIQLLEAILHTYPVAPDEIYKVLYLIRDAFSFQFSSMACVSPKLFKPPGHLIVMLVLPVVSVVFILCLVGITAVGYYVFNFRMKRTTCEERRLLIPKSKEKDWQPFHTFSYQCGGIAIFILSLLYFPIIKLSLMAHSVCEVEKATGVSYMHNYQTVPCYSTLWMEYLVLSSFSLAIYGIFMPIIFCILLKVYIPRRRMLSHIDDKSENSQLAFDNINSFLGRFFNPYKVGFEYVDVGFLFRKLLLAVLLASVPSYSVIQPVSVIIVFAVCLQLQLRYRPYCSDLENYLEETSLWILLFTVAYAGFLDFANVTLTDGQLAVIILVYIVVAVNCFIMVLYIVALLFKLSRGISAGCCRAKTHAA